MEALIEKLEKICVDYNNQLSKYEALMYSTQQTNEKLDKYTETNREKVDRLYMRVENRLENLDSRLEAITAEYKSLFSKYSTEIRSLNISEREAFLDMLLGGLQQYKSDFVQEVMQDYKELLQTFMEQIQEETAAVQGGRKDIEALVDNSRTINKGLSERVQELCIVVDSAMEKTQRTIEGLNERYTKMLEEFSSQVNAVNEEDRARFLGELENSLEKYKENYGLYNDLLEEGRQLNAELAKRTFQNAENIKALEELVNKKLEKTEEILEYISEAYMKGFENLEKDVSVLNARERDALAVAIRTLLEDYRFSFGKEIEGKASEMNTIFQNTLMSVCNSFSMRNKEYEQVLEATKASNAETHRKMEEETAQIGALTVELIRREGEIESALNFLKEGYRETVQQYINDMQVANEKAQALMQESVQRNISGVLERFFYQLDLFKNERKVYLDRMEELVAQEKNSQEQLLESHEQQMTMLGKKQIQLQQQMEENQKALMKCVTRIGTVIIVMLFICIMLLIPWGSSPIWPVLGLAVLIIMGVLGIIYRKKIVKWLR